MKSRRNFLQQGALATTALFALNPLKTFSSAASRVTGLSFGSYGKLAILHTANLHPQIDYKVIQHIKDFRKNTSNAILLDAGQDLQVETGSLTYDASINGGNDFLEMTSGYKIINKGDLRTGIISAKPGERNIIHKIETLSAYLKKEKKCSIVVCLSQLGYQNKYTPDDISLAKKTTHLDIIIGGQPENFHTQPVITLNSNNAEVIIHSASGDSFAYGKIEIDFDEQGRKNHISFANHLSKNISQNLAIPAA